MSISALPPVSIPDTAKPVCFHLPPGIQSLRDRALELQRGPQGIIVERPFADARSWAAHSDDEDWLVWRARRCAERMKSLPLDIEAGERIVGKPQFRQPTEDEQRQLDETKAILETMPPFPGGDTGHFHPDYEKVFSAGIGGILEEIDSRRNDPDTTDEQRTFYDACQIAMEGVAAYVCRVADACDALADQNGATIDSWKELASICRRVSSEPPATFHEAIQLMFFMQIALWFGEDHSLTCPGRMDQTLRRFYEADIAAGRITDRKAFELISCLFILQNRIAWPGTAIAVLVGGRDHTGQDVTNELTYLCLAARQATKLVYPTVGLVWHEDTPDELMEHSIEMLATGIGDPAFFNDEVISQGLLEHGVSEEDCHDYMNSTCVEIKVVGRSNMWVTAPYINLPQALLNVIEQINTGKISEPDSFSLLENLVRDDLATTIRDAAERMDDVWHNRETAGCFPLASCVMKDCLQRGRDYDRGGARYNWVENSFVGLANLVDAMIAVKQLVYKDEALSLTDLHGILLEDFAGNEVLRQRILNTMPKYGNDHEEADTMASGWAEFVIESTDSCTVGPHRYVPGMFCWIMHERLGSETGATPDGRHSGLPLADGAGAAQGRERAGPTASVLSTTKWSHQKVLGGVVHNVKFSKRLLKTDRDRRAVRSVIETFLKRGGFEIQVNVVGKEVLLDAQKHPDQYQDLLVRVAGYSDYFIHMSRKMQNEVIERVEHAM